MSIFAGLYYSIIFCNKTGSASYVHKTVCPLQLMCWVCWLIRYRKHGADNFILFQKQQLFMMLFSQTEWDCMQSTLVILYLSVFNACTKKKHLFQFLPASNKQTVPQFLNHKWCLSIHFWPNDQSWLLLHNRLGPSLVLNKELKIDIWPNL